MVGYKTLCMHDCTHVCVCVHVNHQKKCNHCRISFSWDVVVVYRNHIRWLSSQLLYVSVLYIDVVQTDRKKPKKSSRLRTARRRRRYDSGNLSESEIFASDMRMDSDLSEGTVYWVIIIMLHFIWKVLLVFCSNCVFHLFCIFHITM